MNHENSVAELSGSPLPAALQFARISREHGNRHKKHRHTQGSLHGDFWSLSRSNRPVKRMAYDERICSASAICPEQLAESILFHAATGLDRDLEPGSGQHQCQSAARTREASSASSGIVPIEWRFNR